MNTDKPKASALGAFLITAAILIAVTPTASAAEEEVQPEECLVPHSYPAILCYALSTYLTVPVIPAPAGADILGYVGMVHVDVEDVGGVKELMGFGTNHPCEMYDELDQVTCEINDEYIDPYPVSIASETQPFLCLANGEVHFWIDYQGQGDHADAHWEVLPHTVPCQESEHE